ncbi:MAG: type II CAAX endopeptidase family protein [Litorimonas sp.]
MTYYDRNSNGGVRWYDFVAVFWLMLATWIIGQMAFTSPFIDMLADLDPETHAQLMEILGSPDIGVADAAMMGVAFILLLIGPLMAAIGLGVHYLGTKGRPSLMTGLIGAFLSFAAGGLFIAGSSGLSEINPLILSVIGLSPVAYLLMLLTFPAALAGLYLGWKIVHKLPLTALHTAWDRFRWKRAAQAFLMFWAILGLFTIVTSQFSDTPPALQFDAERFAVYALISLIFLPIQSATEEIVVRGYMNKGLIHMLGNKWVVFVITSGLFTALHLGNPEALSGAESGNLAIVMSGYFFFGFAACLMVLIDDGLESAIGFHAANNTFAAIFVNYEGSVLPTPSIWIADYDANAGAIGTIVVLAISLALLYWTRTPRVRHDPTVI